MPRRPPAGSAGRRSPPPAVSGGAQRNVVRLPGVGDGLLPDLPCRPRRPPSTSATAAPSATSVSNAAPTATPGAGASGREGPARTATNPSPSTTFSVDEYSCPRTQHEDPPPNHRKPTTNLSGKPGEAQTVR